MHKSISYAFIIILVPAIILGSLSYVARDHGFPVDLVSVVLTVVFSLAAFVIPMILFLYLKKIKTIVSFLILFSLSALYVFNFANLTYSPYSTFWNAAISAGIDFDGRDKIQVLADLREDGVEAHPTILPDMFLQQYLQTGTDPTLDAIYPLGGIPNVTTVYCNESGQYAIYESDRYGYNNRDTVFDEGRIDILLVGDSMIHAGCRQPGEDVAAQLRARGYSAATLAMANNSPLVELASLSEYGHVIRPAIVLWTYYEGDDLPGVLQDAKHPTLIRYLDQEFSQDLATRTSEVDAFLRRYAAAWEAERAAELSAFYYRRALTLGVVREYIGLHGSGKDDGTLWKVDDEGLLLFKRALERAQAITVEIGAEMYFVFLPDRRSFLPGYRSARSEVFAIVGDLGIPMINFDDVLRNSDDPLDLYPFRIGGHYTAEAHQMLAQHIIEKTNERPSNSGDGGID